MQLIDGFWFPADLPVRKCRHGFTHVRSADWAMAQCARRRTALQAGGNVGLWPHRLSKAFARVITFEPEPTSFACLERNVPETVERHQTALGAEMGTCDISRKSVGSHKVTPGSSISTVTIDSLGIEDLDLLQLDVEGYEWHALAGGADTILRCRPLIQVELRDHGQAYGHGDADVRALLASFGYREVSRQPGSDVVFRCAA